MTDKDEIAARLGQARLAAGFESAREAAHRMGWPEPTYAQHENGTRGIRLPVAQKYAAAFGTTASWILHGEGPATTDTTKRPVVGMAEQDVAPYEGGTPQRKAMMRQIARAVEPLDQHPAYYIAQRTRPDMLIAKGDILVLSLREAATENDTVVVQVFDERGEAVTQIRQLLGGVLLADRDATDRAIPIGDQRALVRGKVIATIRAAN